MLNRFSGYQFENGLTVANRVVVPPMASQTANVQGQVTEGTLRHYENLSQAGAGLLLVEYSFVHVSGRSEPNQLGAHVDHRVPGLKSLAHLIHASGALAGLQLVHAGGKTSEEISGHQLMGPSAIPVPVKGNQLARAFPMTKRQIDLWIDWFTAAAERAVAAGFDIVELHSAHGYGLNQWLSPLTNQRTDGYGGSLQNRARLLFEVIESVHQNFPHLLISVRLPGQDHLSGGLIATDMKWVVHELESRGVSLINVSSGIGGWRRPEGRGGQGYLVDDAFALKKGSRLPIIGVGGIETGDYIDESLRASRFDFAAVGRAILRDPAAWGKTNLKSNRPKQGQVMRDSSETIFRGV